MNQYRIGQLVSTVKNKQSNDNSDEKVFLGHIRYIGPIGSFKSTYVGVEWLEEGRGSNNGSYKDISYFTCTESMGSFLKEGTFIALPSFSDILLDRYTYSEEKLSDLESEASSLSLTNSLSSKDLKIEFVGVTHSALQKTHAENRREMSFADEAISELGDLSVIQEYMASIHHLDLSNTLFSSEDLKSIISSCKSLKFLNISNIKIDWAQFQGIDAISSCNELILKNTNFKLSYLPQLKSVFPNLGRLHLSNNDLWDSNEKLCYSCLDFIDLSATNASWKLVRSFLEYSNVKSLVLARNSLIDDTFEPFSMYNLRFISLDRTAINQWSTLEAMFTTHQENSPMPNLEALRAVDMNLAQSYFPAVFRRLIISRLSPSLVEFNGTRLSQRELDNNRLTYVNQLIEDIKDGLMSTIECKKLHPRVYTIAKEYSLERFFDDNYVVTDDRIRISVKFATSFLNYTQFISPEITIDQFMESVYSKTGISPENWTIPPYFLIASSNKRVEYSNLPISSLYLSDFSEFYFDF